MNQIWASNPNSTTCTFLMSGLKVFSRKWDWCANQNVADLWVVESESDDIDALMQDYEKCPEPKPKVIYLADKFATMPNSNWVFFKTHINIRVFHKWLSVNNFKPDYDQKHLTDDISPELVNALPKWRRYHFMMKYWPNVTQYQEGAEIIMVCSMMMHDWCEYSQLLPAGVDENILRRMLDDAEKEGNLTYLNEPISTHSQNEPEESGKKSVGIFRKIFSRFTS